MSSRILRSVILGFLLTALAGPTGLFAARPFTLEQVMSSPFPSDLMVAPVKGRVAWVFNSRGVRNIWIAEPAGQGGEYSARPLTFYSEDDGQEISELAWTPDGEAVVYARGGDFEFPDRPYPNPRSFAQGVEQVIWVVSLAGGPPRRLAEGRSPAVSPKGDRVAYIFHDQIWLVNIRGLVGAGLVPAQTGRPPGAPLQIGAAGEKVTQLLHALGKCRSLRWSPDGSKLAFVSDRGDHTFIGVYDFASKRVLYLDPSVDRDFSPVWSPDGKRITFIRLPTSRRAFAFGPKREGQPWSIRVADATSGAGREVWRAEAGRGSVFRNVVAEDQIFWGAGDRIVFPWERDGWTHLYSAPLDGGQTQLLTPGEFEVEHISLAPDRQQVIFSSNQDDIDRRHIWRVSVQGNHVAAMTRGSGIEWSPEMTSDGKTIALLRSDAQKPARPAMVEASGELRDLAPEVVPADFPAAQLVAPQQVIISAADGLRIHSQLFLPANAQPGERHPAVVFFHGGSRREMLLGWHYMGYYHNAYALNQYLASQGFVVLCVNYRSGIGYGMEFREALNYGATGASEFNDVMGAGLYLRSRADVDPKRIGLWGGSYGGYLTALGLARASELFAAGVDFHGVHEWNVVIRNFAPSYDPEAQPDAARLAFESSPMASIKTWRSPVLLIQGDDDRNVPFSETVHLVEALRKQGVEFKQLVFPDEIHDFLTYARWLEAYHATAEFLKEHLESGH